MADSDLLFEFAPATNGDLVFGGAGGAPARVDAELSATLPALSVSLKVIPDVVATLSAALPSLTFSASMQYTSYAGRPTVGATASDWQPAVKAMASAGDSVANGGPLQSGSEDAWTTADKVRAAVAHSGGPAKPIETQPLRSGHSDGVKLRSTCGSIYQDGVRSSRASFRSSADNATQRTHARSAPHQDCLHGSRSAAASWYKNGAFVSRPFDWGMLPGVDMRTALLSRQQDAQKPPPGIRAIVVPPGVNPCYTPNGDLLFKLPFGSTGNLLFICDRYTPVVPPQGLVVVPVKRVYMQLNSQSLVLASNGAPIEASALSLALDVDSWVWGWSATVPADYLPVLQADYGSAVELIATINGTAFRLAVERVQRDRSFGKAVLAISGRGRAAWLAKPYHNVEIRWNETDRTAQQLMSDALTINGVPNGWSVDWNITDWLVPAGAWSHTGTPMDACATIAAAAGAYVQADRLTDTLHVYPRYPSVPWGWGALTPDIELPEDACVTEGIEWQDNPDYDSIYVSGEAGGILGYVKRTGSVGDKPAPMIVDPLITHTDAARQRGIAELSKSGRSKIITLQLPILAETGIIVPGKTIKYTESGVHHIGISRAVRVSSSFPKIRQSLTVESYVL